MPVVGHHVTNAVVVCLPQPPNGPRVCTARPQDTFADIHSEKHPASSVLRLTQIHTPVSHSLSENELKTCTPLLKILCLLLMKYLIGILGHWLFYGNELKIIYVCFPVESAVKMQIQKLDWILKWYRLALKRNMQSRNLMLTENYTNTLWNIKLKLPQRGPLMDGFKSNLNPPSQQLSVWRRMP